MTLNIAWMTEAVCAQVDPDLNYPEVGGDAAVNSRTAIAICNTCPVRVECLDYSIANNEQFGIWGGVPERKRRKMIAAAKRAAG